MFMQKSPIENREMFLTKKFTFDSAHKLPNHKGKCKNLHGHTYVLEVTIRGGVDEKTGMVMDFKDIKEVVSELVLEKIDHQYINEIIRVPTAENTAKWIWEILYKNFLKYGVKLQAIKLWENPDSYVTYKLSDYED